MPKMRNTVTGDVNWMPASYVGQFPFEVVEEAAVVEPQITLSEPVEPAPAKPKKKKAEYNAAAPDADGDGKVQDGTIFERDAGTELSPEKVTELLASDSE
jgi:hypothetical protein